GDGERRESERGHGAADDQQLALPEPLGEPSHQPALQAHLDDADETEEIAHAADQERMVSGADPPLDEERERGFHHREAEHEEEVDDDQKPHPWIRQAAAEMLDPRVPR